jgi:hypothetical protein
MRKQQLEVVFLLGQIHVFIVDDQQWRGIVVVKKRL